MGAGTEPFAAPQALVAISATLLPVLMKANADAEKRKRASGAGPSAAAAAAEEGEGDETRMYPFFTQRSEKYVGVISNLWKPFERAGEPAFLPAGALKSSNVGIDDDGLVRALYADAASKPKSLLLDITVTRVNVANSVRGAWQ
jgi:hypothetical protein